MFAGFSERSDGFCSPTTSSRSPIDGDERCQTAEDSELGVPLQIACLSSPAASASPGARCLFLGYGSSPMEYTTVEEPHAGAKPRVSPWEHKGEHKPTNIGERSRTRTASDLQFVHFSGRSRTPRSSPASAVSTALAS